MTESYLIGKPVSKWGCDNIKDGMKSIVNDGIGVGELKGGVFLLEEPSELI